MSSKNFSNLIRENKTLFVIIAVVLLLIELEIFALAVMKSGRKSRLQVIDDQGSVIHEADGKNLSQFNKYYFEKTFGPLERYRFKLVTKEIPFPFRAWFAAAVGIPVGAILLLGFAVRAFQSLFFGEDLKKHADEPPKTLFDTRFEKIIAVLSRFNIFTIGFLVFLAVFGYWVIPNLLLYTGRLGIETLARYKWFFLTAGLVVLGLVVWIIYLKYLLARRSIDSQTEIEKHRLQLELNPNHQRQLRLEHHREDAVEKQAVPMDENTVGSRGNMNDRR